MRNLVPFNQLASWNHLEKTINRYVEQDELINDYYQCIIECDDNQRECKRVCRSILSR